MRAVRRGVVVGGVLAALLAGTGAASAAVPTPTTIAGSRVSGAPVIFVDARGTVNALWTGTQSGGFPTVRYAREPAGAKRFTQVALPNMPSTLGNPFIYEPSAGVLEVVVNVNGSFNLEGWTSTNDGMSWQSVPTTPQETWAANGLYLRSDAFFTAPGGPLDYAGNNGGTGAIVALNSALSQATTVGTDSSAITVEGLGRSADGTVFVLGAPDSSAATATFPFQAGANTGQLTFPCAGTAAVAGTTYRMAVGRSLAAVAFAGCGHVWTRTVSAAGAVGPLVAIGAGPGANASGQGSNGSAWVGLVAGGGGAFTAAYTVAGNDLGVAHSADGAHWSTAPGLVPVQGADPVYGGAARSLSEGTADWVGISPQTPSQAYRIQVMPLTKTYRPPAAPSGRSIAAARKAHLGSMAVTAPGIVAKRSFAKTGTTVAKVIDALGGKVTAELSVTNVQGTTTYDICSGSIVARLAPGRAKTLTIPCANGAIVIGGVSSTLPVVKKGYVVTFTFVGRNGAITVNSRIG
jgi:hypothetical protein